MKFYGAVILLFMCFAASGQDLKELTFTFTKSATVRMGKEWDFTYTPLSSPLTIVLKDNVLKGTLANGQVWGEFKVAKTKLVEDKDTEKSYNIFIESEGELDRVIYNISAGRKELLFPMVLKGKVTSYIYYK